MFKDRLMTALNDAITHFNDGSDENKSVVKAASDHGFNLDQTQRLVESFNTAKTICFYKKADDRSADFPTADPDVVIADLFGEPKEEVKVAADSYTDYSYYEVAHPELDKTAEFTDIDPWAGFGDDVYTDKEAEARQQLSAREGLIDARKACDNAALQSSTRYDMVVEKIASELSRSAYYNELVYDEFHSYGKAIDKMANAVVETVFDRIPTNREDCTDTIITSFDTDFPKIAEGVKQAAALLQEATVMQTMAIDLAKQAADYSDEIGVTEEPDELDGFIPKQAENIYGTALNNLANSVSREATGGVLNGMKGVMTPNNAAQKQFAERAQNKYRQLMLERLIVTDPILRGAEEQSVLRAYETLVELAPEVSLKEDVTRSILREAVTTTAMSPYDAKGYVDLDAAIKKQVAAPAVPKEVHK